MIALAISFASCDKQNPDNGKDNGQETPPEEEITGFGTLVNSDGSILVESDNGVDRINSIIKAIEEYAGKDGLAVTEADPETGEIVETGEKVKCSNIFYLQRDGVYYIQGKGKISSEVTVKAEDGDGALPTISPLSDATGQVVADMLVLEASATFENIHFYERDPITNMIQERVFRVEAADSKLVLDNCFNEYCRNHYIRMEADGVTVELKNSTFRNFAMGASTNGRVIDARKTEMKEVNIENCLFYNVTGKIIRQDGNPVNKISIRNSTFYNCGYGIPVTMPETVIIENNIFANCGYYTAAFPYALDENGEHDLDPISNLPTFNNEFWDFTDWTQIQADQETIELVNGADLAKINITIRNNNIYNEQWLLDRYASTGETLAGDPITAPVLELGKEEQWLKDQGATIVMENNDLNEVLDFEKSCGALSSEYLDRIMSGDDDGSPITESYYVTGDYSYNYTSGKSLTAATDGGRLGIRQ